VTGNGSNDSAGPVSESTPSSDDSVQALRLRADHPRITRLSRKVLAGGHRTSLVAHRWRRAVGAEEQPSTQYDAGRTLQHGSSQRCRWSDNVCRRIMPGFLATSLGLGHHCRATWGAPSLRWKANQHRSVLTPNNNVPIRKPRRLGRAKYLRRPLRPSRHRMPHPRKRRPKLRHLLTKPSLRTGRIANSCSSMPRWIGGLQRPIGSHVQRHPLSCKQERSFLQLLLRASARIFLARSRRR